MAITVDAIVFLSSFLLLEARHVILECHDGVDRIIRLDIERLSQRLATVDDFSIFSIFL
jgi:hypothetical protein